MPEPTKHSDSGTPNPQISEGADDYATRGGGALGGVQRPLQLALVEGEERAVGPVIHSVFSGSNADLMAAVAPLYLSGSVLDVTFGRGKWWGRFSPQPFGFHDLEVDGVDFRALPHETSSWDTVCFDPPYVPRHGQDDAPTADLQKFRDAYGLEVSRSLAELEELIGDGLAECSRVARRWVLVKCGDYTNGRALHLGHLNVLQEGMRLGLVVHDLIVHHSGLGPGGTGRSLTLLRARRAHTYLVVFRVPSTRRRSA